MSTVYVAPQVLVFQDFQASPQAQANPLQAHIAGGEAQLIRFNQTTEQSQGLLGVYDPLDDAVFDWPNRPAGGVVDQTYTQLWIKNAILRYFDSGTDGVTDLVKVASYNNRVRSASFNFKTNGENAHDSTLLDRDVTIGDTVRLRWDTGSGVITQWTYVNGFVPDLQAAAISTVVADTGNATTTGSASATSQQTRGPWNAVRIDAQSAASYDPTVTGKVTEKYTIIVTGGSVNGDHTSATLRVISASGLDDQASVTPSHRGVATAIGTHGATVTFNNNDGSNVEESESAIEQGVSPDDFIVGQTWVLNVTANYTAPVATANDTSGHASTPYTGVADTTYIVTVTKGGLYAAYPQISVTTTTGVDTSGPTNVNAAASFVAVGTKGVTIKFSGTGLTLGDRYYIPVTASTAGRIGTIVLGHNIPTAVADGTSAELTLYIKKASLQVSENRTGEAPLTNFDQSETQITVHSGITAYDPTWTDAGVPQPLPLDADVSQSYSVMYVQVRYWIQTNALTLNGISDVGTINTAFLGALDPDNPLKWGVFQALSNSNGVTVMYTAVTDPSISDNWADVLGLLTGRSDVYGLVPLTRDGTVQALYNAHVNDESSPDQGNWRVAWFSMAGVPTVPIVSTGSTIPNYLTATTTDGNPALATISDDPDSVGTQYTIVAVPGGNAQFITNGVQSGDIVRAFYADDGFGDITYQEYIVDEVQTQDQLRLLSGPGMAVTQAAKIEIWRNLVASDEAAAIGLQAGAWSNRRIRAVWPDTIGQAGTMMDGFHLCAALAGLASGILPQQGMTRLQISGFDDVTRTTKKFNSTQLNTMAGSGVWIVTQDPSSGNIYTRHAVTTGPYSDINQREEMITRNLDSISFTFKDAFSPYLGICNVTPSMQQILEGVVQATVNSLKTVVNKTLGGQLIDATLVSLAPSLTLADRYVVVLDATLPAPFNNAEIHLVV